MNLTHREIAAIWIAFRALPTKNGELAVAVDTEEALRTQTDRIGVEEKQVKEISETETLDVTAEKATWRHMRKLYDEFGDKHGWPGWAVRAAHTLGPKLTGAAGNGQV